MAEKPSQTTLEQTPQTDPPKNDVTITVTLDPMIWARCRRMYGPGTQATDSELAAHIIKTRLWEWDTEQNKRELGV